MARVPARAHGKQTSFLSRRSIRSKPANPDARKTTGQNGLGAGLQK
jgi:hypothetical protein